MPALVTERSGLLGWCRPGFEPELAAEFSERAAAAGIAGYAKTERGSGQVLFLLAESQHPAATTLYRALPWASLIFARQVLRLLAEFTALDPADRIAPLLAWLQAQQPRQRYGELVVEHADSDAAKPLAGLARAFGNALRTALRREGLLTAKETDQAPRLHVAVLDGQHMLLADANAAASPSWAGGIPRLRRLSDAPSRSASKLDEAFSVLLSADERQRWLQPGMRAADLGAAPGGWSWVLARQQIRVTAIDNGPLADTAMATGLIDHLRADGFTWKPAQPLDWMVCDMVDTPRKVSERMAIWFREGWCRRAIFNLKLPMKKRWEETRLCLDQFREQCGGSIELRAKQLFHDREEITVLAWRPGR